LLEVIIAGIILGITLAFMVGPVFLLLIETSLTKGAKKAIVLDLGVLAADVFFIALVALGSGVLLKTENVTWIYFVGGLLIIGYGIYNVVSAKKKQKKISADVPLPVVNGNWVVYFAKGFFLNFLNVGVFAYWLTTTVTLRATLKGAANEGTLMLVYFVTTVLAYFATDLIKIFTAQRIKSLLTPAMLIKIERIVGFVLMVFGALLIVRGYLTSIGIGF
jgi:threonine/homoserine/homoserine lactone efflux protein